ncbi:Hypothetical protein KQS_08035 [Flavobacterium indicum GPTSA100-9 = DSM 17447]|uniref:Uncharacterized protein n=1 Tax=Flavobacterium indicum (strain DSM 17447 / CIP 109464 / GPTSA100-9) TaxID=1094466 RepID=H8XT09_FLAIG|nr:Hypothetical protein KQS_08035 [Flavobacterium indicum GPTSA100-9 = DSM 17447]
MWTNVAYKLSAILVIPNSFANANSMRPSLSFRTCFGISRLLTPVLSAPLCHAELVCFRLFASLESASIQENLNQVQVDKRCGQTLRTNCTQSLSFRTRFGISRLLTPVRYVILVMLNSFQHLDSYFRT